MARLAWEESTSSKTLSVSATAPSDTIAKMTAKTVCGDDDLVARRTA